MRMRAGTPLLFWRDAERCGPRVGEVIWDGGFWLAVDDERDMVSWRGWGMSEMEMERVPPCTLR